MTPLYVKPTDLTQYKIILMSINLFQLNVTIKCNQVWVHINFWTSKTAAAQYCVKTSHWKLNHWSMNGAWRINPDRLPNTHMLNATHIITTSCYMYDSFSKLDTFHCFDWKKKSWFTVLSYSSSSGWISALHKSFITFVCKVQLLVSFKLVIY